MEQKDLESKSKEDLIKIIDDIYSSPYINVYFSIKTQLDKLAKKIEKEEIIIGERSFDAFIKWGEKSLIITDNLQGILGKLDARVVAEETKKRLAAGKGSVEDYVVIK